MQWRLDLTPAPPAAPALLDVDQQRVVDHRTGPLLVLAGPGTGKTTTIVEAIRSRVEDADEPLAHDAVLALTFGRKAATELRDRVTARLGGGIVPTVATFHSFAYGLLRRTDAADDYLRPPRLMSGAEEDVRIRELLKGAVADGSIDWPDDLVGALPTLGLANEVRAVLARARELGLEGSDLRRIGSASGRPAWVAVGQLARQEQEVMILENVIDYTELIFRALLRASEPDVSAALHRQYRAIYVDEYQDTDRLQVALLRALAGPQTSVVAVGDPDQAIYGFRGADVRGLLRFPDTFRTAAGDPAPVAVLGHTRRFGPRIRAAATAVLGSRLPPGLPVAQARAHRAPLCIDQGADRDTVSVRVYDDRGAQAAHVARELRLAHVRRGVAWRDMAVLVRSGQQLPVLQRTLLAAGVPVVVAADEIPLRSEPAVAVLLAALRVAADASSSTPAEVIDILTGPLVSLTTGDVRRLGRALRREHHAAGTASPPSDVLIRRLVLGRLLADVEPGMAADRGPLEPADPVTVALDRLRALLTEVHGQMASGADPQAVLWTIWTGGGHPHGWPQRLRSAALQGSRSAGHDVDAVMALFDAAERLSGRYPGFLGVRMFLDSLADQQIPAEPVADRGTRTEAVRLLTAHRAKGLEWDEVWVVGLEEGVWPDLRARGSTLRAEELTASGIGAGPRPADLLEEERRLFYVACTRARAHLHLSAIDENDQGGDRPSRFLDDLAARDDAIVIERAPGRPLHAVSLDGLVAELRSVAMDLHQPAALREAACQRLALLAAERDDAGAALVPLADPAQWWGLRGTSPGARPVRDPEQPVSLSGSGLDALLSCPMRWFLEHEAHAETSRGPATSFGSVVHAVADFVAKGDIPEDLDEMDAQVDRIWSELRFEARWQSESERREARSALERFLAYHVRRDRELIDTEAAVGAVVTVPTPDGGDDSVRLRGFIDRVERDGQGRVVPIDLKNMRRGVPDAEIPEHGQLGVYQLLLRESGALGRTEGDALGGAQGDALDGPRVDVGGAALVQLRVPAGKGAVEPKVQFQEALGDQSPTWVERKLGQAAQTIRREAFPATLGPSCRFCAYRSACPAQPEGEQVAP
ncbi:MAG: ATP-dependent helicase [Actinobacteria bacterium]|nr:ATP-dependent helicase [Actinomycetota bacterium]